MSAIETNRLINSLAINTQTGVVYAYLISDLYKRKVLYFNGHKHFIKENGTNIFFHNEEDKTYIKEYLEN
jgi:hypothetical protein